MATQQAYHAYAQTKGTLVPGQSISVNKYTVQVERYLSQGGFAHVYLVRTPTPVYNTTHHVLKRIAVANEAMLTDVKKEVDIMRLLKGHPNIVHLIDAAWHKMPNGMYEVFILMEYCPGGGIIDMMNRRLRERLTESEILQIFVDVCEGVAYMHNSRPPLLHRDLKVENILQSSPTSFKLCDFGSATTVSRPPTSTQDIRALEADLNRHTTLQYRAPEMIDVYSKRPIDEKSDIWALGVLLYKLCYYTTPFEEHGPLAILNVQYRTPPYPVYSSQMNGLISLMLKEHGSQRPTVFELLALVHRLRGTKSQFHYDIPAQQPLSPQQHQFRPSPPSNALEGTVTYNSSALYQNKAPTMISAPVNQGIQAREKVLDAIAPMRRGRPTVTDSQPTSRSSTPQKSVVAGNDKPRTSTNGGFAAEEDKAWRAATAGKVNNGLDDAWTIHSADHRKELEKASRPTGFGDDFGEKLWNSSDPNATNSSSLNSRRGPPSSAPVTKTSPSLPLRPLTVKQELSSNNRDAFDGLGLMAPGGKPAPTLGEARKLRTGLAIMSTTSTAGGYKQDKDLLNPVTSPPVNRPSPSPRLSYISSSPLQSTSTSPVPQPATSSSGMSWRSSPQLASVISPSDQSDGLPAESRFPSLEELDAKFPGSGSSPAFTPAQQYTWSDATQASQSPPQLPPRSSNIGSSGTGALLKPSAQSHGSYAHDDGTRSAHVTGVAMRQSRLESARRGGFEDDTSSRKAGRSPLNDESATATKMEEKRPTPRPLLTRKYRSSISVKHPESNAEASNPSKHNQLQLPKTSSLSPSPRIAPRDWLTGEDDDNQDSIKPAPEQSGPSEVPVLRDSPSKRASFTERSNITIQEAAVPQQGLVSPPRSTLPTSAELSPTVSRFARAFPPIDTAEAQKSEPLTDNWSPVAATTPIPNKAKEQDSSSSGDEGPEDADRLKSPAKSIPSMRTRRKGRQSSVHDLVDLYGGGLASKEKEKESTSMVRDITSSTDVSHKPRSKGIPPPITSKPLNPRSMSPPLKSSPSLPSPSPGKYPPGDYRKPTSATSPATGRSRPQSMFIFPPKATEILTAVSPSLMPPEEPRPRSSVRRTSISDMVQRYEAIGAPKSPVPGPGPPSPIAMKPHASKVPVRQAENGRYGKVAAESTKANSLDASSVQSDSFKDHTNGSRNSVVSRSPVVTQRSLPRAKEDSTTSKEATLTNPRTRKLSSKPSFPVRKPTLALDEVASPTSDGRSSSPERPYQGVGKLIDQWQRKTVDADPARNAIGKRGGWPVKRAGAPTATGRGD